MMRVMKLLPDCRIPVFRNTLKKVSRCVADIICIAQITYKMINNVLLIETSLGLRSCSNFLLTKLADISRSHDNVETLSILKQKKPALQGSRV